MSRVKFFYILFFIASFATGIFFRFWKMPYFSMFHGDQGADLLVALRIVRGEYFPFVGPVLSVKGFLNPATYYYILAIFLKICSSESALFTIMAVLNLFSGVLYAIVLKRKTDTPTAMLFFCLYMVAFLSVQQGRMIWNPYIATPFLAAGMFLFIIPWKNFRVFQYILAVETVALGISIYPTGALLIPVYMHFSYRYLLSMYNDRLRAFLISVGLFAFSLLLTNMTFIVYESAYGFPTINAVFISNKQNSVGAKFIFNNNLLGLRQRSIRLVQGIYYMLYPQYFQNGFMMDHSRELIVIIVVSFIFMSTQFRSKSWRLKFASFSKSIGYPFILWAVAGYIFFDSNYYTYRVLILLPFLLFYMAFMVRNGLIFPSILVKFFSVMSIILFLYMNSVSNVFDINDDFNMIYQPYGHVVKLYTYIVADVHKRGLSFQDVDYRTIASTPDWDNYESVPLLYLLYKYDGHQVQMNPLGNDVLRSKKMSNEVRYAYVNCFSQFILRNKCWNIFVKDNPNSEIIQKTEVKPYYIFFVKKVGDTWGPKE